MTTSTPVTKELVDVAVQGCRDELTDYTVYKRLAESSNHKNPSLSRIFSKLADAESRHYEFWKRYCGPNGRIGVSSLSVCLVLVLRSLFGPTFAVRYLEKHEEAVIRRYKSVAHLIPPEDKPEFEAMIVDEEEHENDFASEMQAGRVSYLSFVVLGLADALVEIAGIHAGSLGIYRTTELTGLAGIIAGAAASIAMASAAFAQAKSGFKGSASLSAVYTGVSYFINAVILATPYFLTKQMYMALFSSIALGIIIIAFISYYNSVVQGDNLRKDFAELTGVMLGATLALYVIGTVIRAVLGITV